MGTGWPATSINSFLFYKERKFFFPSISIWVRALNPSLYPRPHPAFKVFADFLQIDIDEYSFICYNKHRKQGRLPSASLNFSRIYE